MMTVELRDIENNVVVLRQEVLDSVLPVSISDAQKQMELFNSCGEYAYIVVYASALSHKLNINLNTPF